MSKRILAIPIAGLLLPGIFLFCRWCQAATPDRTPLQVELIRVVDAGRVKAGDSVLAKVTVKWQSPQCTLREGAILDGRIVAQTAHSKTDRVSQIALLFESGQCDGLAMKPLPMTVSAVLAGDPNRDTSNYANQPLSDAVGLGLGRDPGPSGINGSAGGMRSISQAAATVYASPPVYRGPTTVMPGQVVGIRGVKLDVGGGPEGSSVLSMSGHNVRLEAGSQLVLMPNLNAVTATPAAAVASAPVTASGAATEKAPENVVPSDETEVCLPPECSVALAPMEPEIKTSAAADTLAVRRLGYIPIRPDHEMYSFDYGSTISYLGASELLFTFNPHILVTRAGTEAGFSKLRIIRAALIDVQEKKVIRTVEWKVPDSQQYLWIVGRDHVLVHVGRELRLYGPGLKQEQHLALNGPLAFVRISPSSRYFAVGVTQERHSEAVHKQLEEAEDRAPEEDVEVKVLDGSFYTLATVMRSSRAPVPVLSDNGEIQIASLGKNRWRISEEAWDTQKRVLANVNSSCPPETTTLPPGLLFVVGCDRQSGGKWYRMLRFDGRPVLKGTSSSTELEQIASGIASSGDFTVGVAEAAKSMAASSAFTASDIASEHIAVYRAENGERIFAVAIPSPVTSVQTFALSPDGRQLVVLAGDQIAFYQVPASGGHQ